MYFLKHIDNSLCLHMVFIVIVFVDIRHPFTLFSLLLSLVNNISTKLFNHIVWYNLY